MTGDHGRPQAGHLVHLQLGWLGQVHQGGVATTETTAQGGTPARTKGVGSQSRNRLFFHWPRDGSTCIFPPPTDLVVLLSPPSWSGRVETCSVSVVSEESHFVGIMPLKLPLVTQPHTLTHAGSQSHSLFVSKSARSRRWQQSQPRFRFPRTHDGNETTNNDWFHTHKLTSDSWERTPRPAGTPSALRRLSLLVCDG